MFVHRLLLRSTIHGQISAIVLLGLAIVMAAGSMLERWMGNENVTQSIERLANRTFTIGALLKTATPGERESILASAQRNGWALTLQPLSLSEQFTSSSPTETFLDVALEWLFPPDDVPIPLGGWRTFSNGDRVIAVRVSDESMLVLGSIPSASERGEFWGEGSSYLVALITLNILFSVFAVWAITRPIRRIAFAATQGDTQIGSDHFEERGSVEIVALARALNAMRRRISTMIDSRTRMLRGISHDLRTPLTRMRLRTERVAEAELRDALLADIGGIERLLKESLTYLQDEHKRENVERADLAAVLQTICNEFSDVGHKITYRGPNRLAVIFRPLAMSRAVTNLCENAVKFGHDVVVELNSDSDAITIDVVDNGPGISELDRNRVLEPFYKVDPARGGTHSGFGLGLSIVSEIIQGHRGKLELLDRQPTGLIARLTMPVG